MIVMPIMNTSIIANRGEIISDHHINGRLTNTWNIQSGLSLVTQIPRRMERTSRGLGMCITERRIESPVGRICLEIQAILSYLVPSTMWEKMSQNCILFHKSGYMDWYGVRCLIDSLGIRW